MPRCISVVAYSSGRVRRAPRARRWPRRRPRVEPDIRMSERRSNTSLWASRDASHRRCAVMMHTTSRLPHDS